MSAEAEEAAARWGGAAGRVLGNRENVVHALRLADGRRAVLRLHRAGYQDDAAIAAELAWVAALAARGVPVAAPVPARDGGFLVTLASGRRASVLAWVAGRPLGRGGVPLAGTPQDQAARFRALGRLLRRLHAETDALALPVPFARPVWDTAGLTGQAPVWGRFWDHPAASPAQAEALRATRAALAGRLAGWQAGGADIGPIHADLLGENVLFFRRRPALIDFDDCGTGFRLYDLGTALLQHQAEPAYPALRDALCAGYGAADPGRVEWFALARACASVGWTMPRLAPGDPVHRSHIARALGLAERLL